MNEMTAMFDAAVYRLGWMLVHSIWQAALVALLLAIALRAGRGKLSSSLRYAVSYAALFIIAGAGATTLMVVRPPADLVRSHHTTGATRITDAPNDASPSILASTLVHPQTPAQPWNPENALPWLVGAWVIGVMILSVWQLGGWMILQRWRHSAKAVEADLQQRVDQLAWKMAVKRVVLKLSEHVDVPIVIGVWRPVVLAPMSILTDLSASQLEAILAHELAHVRRLDYIANLIHVAIETLLFYHPAIWWISRQIRLERECCCDELAARVCGDPAEYAQALASLEILRPVLLAPAASGAGRGELLVRVRRLMGGRADEQRSRPAAVPVLLMILCLAGAIAGRMLLAQSTQPGAQRYGRVVDDNDQPVASAQVWQIRWSSDLQRPVVIASALTDRLGQFQIPRSGDDANITVSALPYALSGALIRWSAPNDPSIVQVHPSAKLRLHLLAPDQTPAAGVKVRIIGMATEDRRAGISLPQELNDPSVVQTSDEKGECLFDRLPKHGLVLLEMSDERFAGLLSSESRVTLGDAEITDADPIRLRPAASISGRIISADSGRGIGGIQVRVRNRQGSRGSTALTDDEGKYTLKQLDPGKYFISANLSDQVSLNFAAAALADVEATLQAPSQAPDIKLIPGATIYGKIVDRASGKPQPDVPVRFDRLPNDPLQPALSARSGADGVYRIHVLPGNLQMQLIPSLGAGIDTPNPSAYIYVVTIADGDTIEKDFAVTTHPLANVTGHTVDTDGHPIAGADILIQRKGDSPPGVTIANSDENGNFAIPNLETSSRLRARKGKSSTLEHGEFTLDKTYVTLVLHPNAASSIHATVHQADGSPIPGATVTIIKGSRSDGDTLQRTTGLDGKCLFAQLETDFGYQINAYAKGFGIVRTTVTVEGGKQTEAEPIVLPKAESFVAGIAVDAAGAPLPNKHVMLRSALSAPQTVLTDITGHFRMDGIMAGDHVTVGIVEEDQYGSVPNVVAGTDNVIISAQSRQ